MKYWRIWPCGYTGTPTWLSDRNSISAHSMSCRNKLSSTCIYFVFFSQRKAIFIPITIPFTRWNASYNWLKPCSLKEIRSKNKFFCFGNLTDVTRIKRFLWLLWWASSQQKYVVFKGNFFTLDRALGTTESESNSKDISYFKNEKFTQQDYMISLKRAAERLRIIQQSRYYAFSLRITWHDSTYVSNTSAILFCHVNLNSKMLISQN